MRVSDYRPRAGECRRCTNLVPGSTVRFQVVAGNDVQQGVATDDQTLTTAHAD